MIRNFICYDRDGYVRSLLHVVEKENGIYKSTIYVAANRSRYNHKVQWAFLKVTNKEEDNIVENSLFIKPFFTLVKRQFYPNQDLIEESLFDSTVDEIVLCKRFEESMNTIKEYHSKKLDVEEIPNIQECTISQLKLSLI